MSTQSPGPSPAPGPVEPTKATKATTSSSIGRGIRTVLYVAVAVVTTLFLLANSQSVEVDYLFGTAETPLFVALAIAMVLGALLTLGAMGIRRVRTRGQRG